MRLIYAAAIAIGILGVALIGSAPAQAANCTQVSVFYGKSINYASSPILGVSMSASGGGTWTFSRSDDNGGSYTVEQTGTLKSWSKVYFGVPTTAATRVKVDGPGCSWVFDPNEAVFNQMQPFYGPY